MSRHFKSFIDGYYEYAKNDFAPPQFTLWTGISLIAAALERRVWLPEGGFRTFPNLFVLLTSGPGVGKSSAINQALPLINGLKKFNKNFKTLEGVSTAAGLRGEMNKLDNMPHGAINPFSSIYIMEGEGSESPLKNHGDDFRSMACQMYDCCDEYRFTLKDDQFHIPQPVMNMLVGVTFDFLGTIIDQTTVFGGLASRMTYVIEKKGEIKGEFFGSLSPTPNKEVISQLTADLISIHKMYGPITVDKSVVPIVTKWFAGFKDEFNNTENERVKSLAVRKRTLLKKLLIILSAAESDSRIMTGAHAERAIELTEQVTAGTEYILAQASIARGDHFGTMEAVKRAFDGKDQKLSDVRRYLLTAGIDPDRVKSGIEGMLGANMIVTLSNGLSRLIEKKSEPAHTS